MKTYAYDEFYLPMAMENLGDALEYAVCELAIEPDDFFQRFLAIGVAGAFGNGNPVFMAGLSGAEMTRCVLERTGTACELPCMNASIYKGAEYWAGWILAYYQWQSGRPFSNIYRYISIAEIIEMYHPLHEASESKFVAVLDEIISKKQETEPTRLQFYRRLAGYSQKQLADVSGITLRSIQMYEQRNKDINKAKFETVHRLSQVLGCRMENLIEYSI